jgi:hypothetical protein
MALSKAKAIIYMTVGILLCIPMFFTFSDSLNFIPVILTMIGGTMFFIGLSGRSGNTGTTHSTVESDLARVRFVEETKMRSGKP